MKSLSSVVPIVIISVLRLLYPSAAAVNNTTKLGSMDSECDLPYSTKLCLQNIANFGSLSPCSQWKEVSDCLKNGRCSQSFVLSQKIQFENKFGVKCANEVFVVIGDRFGNKPTSVTAICGGLIVNCSLRVTLINCGIWHAFRQCFDNAGCSYTEVEKIKEVVQRYKSDYYICGTGALAASIGTISIALAVLLAR